MDLEFQMHTDILRETSYEGLDRLEDHCSLQISALLPACLACLPSTLCSVHCAECRLKSSEATSTSYFQEEKPYRDSQLTGSQQMYILHTSILHTPQCPHPSSQCPSPKAPMAHCLVFTNHNSHSSRVSPKTSKTVSKLHT